MKKSLFLGERRQIERVYAKGRRERVAELTDLYPAIVSMDDFEAHADALREADVVFSTWGMPRLSDAELGLLPRLEAVFYAAGSVQGFARPLLERGIVVVSAWRANGVPVAEFALAQILLANKGYYRNVRDCESPEGRARASHGPGSYGETVALLGAGAIGRKLIELLRPFELNVVVFDPFLSAEDADRLGVEKVTLETAFELGLAVSIPSV